MVARHRHPSVRFAVAFPFVALVLTANLVVPIGTIKAERLLYLPSAGWVLLVAWTCTSLFQTRRYRLIAAGALAVMVTAFGARTWTRNWDWKDNRTLFESVVRSAPNSAKAHYNLGVVLQESGAAAAAVAEFHKALVISPWTEGAALGIGIDFEGRGHVSEAIAWYRKALEIEPGYSDAHTNLCHVLVTGGQHGAAAAACRNGLRYKPADANLLKGLGASLVALGETDKGVEVLRRSLALSADDHELRIYVAQIEGTASARTGRTVTVQ
jgi:Tfp pilus assembly protein PilF